MTVVIFLFVYFALNATNCLPSPEDFTFHSGDLVKGRVRQEYGGLRRRGDVRITPSSHTHLFSIQYLIPQQSHRDEVHQDKGQIQLAQNTHRHLCQDGRGGGWARWGTEGETRACYTSDSSCPD